MEKMADLLANLLLQFYQQGEAIMILSIVRQKIEQKKNAPARA